MVLEVALLGAFWIVTGIVGIFYYSLSPYRVEQAYKEYKLLAWFLVIAGSFYLWLHLIGIITKGSIITLAFFFFLSYPVWRIWHDILPSKRKKL